MMNAQQEHVSRIVERLKTYPVFKKYAHECQKIGHMIAQYPESERLLVWLHDFIHNPAYQSHIETLLSEKRFALFLDVLAYSPFLTQRISADPDIFSHIWMLDPRSEVWTRERWMEELDRFCSLHSDLDLSLSLTLFRHWGWCRILIADIRGALHLNEVTEQLSFLADAILIKAYQMARSEVLKRYGSVEVFADGRFYDVTPSLFALGKWGGYELNYSSDLDLLFVIDVPPSSGELVRSYILDRAQMWARLMLDSVRAYTRAGRAYRIDLRLRPLGKEGELIVTSHQALRYYQQVADIWERQSLLKLRPVYGRSENLTQFMREVQRILRKVPPARELASTLKELRARRLDQLGRRAVYHVKDGPGGIRDIEMIVQSMAWVHLPAHPTLFTGHTMRCLTSLYGFALIKPSWYEHLLRAYEFLRRSEHILQVEENRQVFNLPEDRERQESFAWKMGFRGQKGWEKFLQTYRAHTGRVEEIWKAWLSELERKTASIERPVSVLRSEHAQERWRQLESEQSVLFMLERAPEMHRWLHKILEHGRLYESVVHHLIWFARLYSESESVRAFLEQRGNWSRMIERMLTVSPRLSEILWRYGRLMGEPSFHKLFSPGTDWEAWVRYGHPGGEDWPLARRLRTMDLILAMFECGQHYRPLEIQHLLTLQAREALFTSFQNALPGEEVIEDRNDVLLIGIGRLGTEEMDWGSDADILLISAEKPSLDLIRRVQKWLGTLSTWTEWGYVIKTDLRLRPFGRSGEPLFSRHAFLDYFTHHAQVWEMFAFLKASPISGSIELFDTLLAELIHIWATRNWFTREALKDMIMKLHGEWEKHYDVHHPKFGIGGWMDWWLLVHVFQILVFREVSDDWFHPRTSLEWLKLMKEMQWLPEDLVRFVEALLFVQHFIRLSGESISTLNSATLDELKKRFEIVEPRWFRNLELWYRYKTNLREFLLNVLG